VRVASEVDAVFGLILKSIRLELPQEAAKRGSLFQTAPEESIDR
jgi:hypothetical protein